MKVFKQRRQEEFNQYTKTKYQYSLFDQTIEQFRIDASQTLRDHCWQKLH